MQNNQGRLRSVLQMESTAFDELHAILMREHLALKERNSESITLLSEEKNTILNKLEKLDRERQLCLQNDMQNHTQPVSNEISQLNSEIELCLDKCKKQNNINGSIIEMSKLFNEKMLDIICGNPDKKTTYGATGKNNNDKNQHSLGRV